MLGQKNMLDTPVECFQIERYARHHTPLNKEDAAYMLLTIKHVYDANGIIFLPSYGTLLGMVREDDFIPPTCDIDLMIWAKDYEKALSLTPELEKYGIRMECYVLPWIFTYIYKDVPCDIDVLHEAIWPWNKWFCLTHEMYIPKAFFENTAPLEFLGKTFIAPANPEKLLEYHYGKTWRIPSSTTARIESYVFFWRYAHRFIKRCIRWFKRKIRR